MKIAIGKFRVAQDALSKLLTAELPVKIAFRLSRLYKVAQENLTAVEEQRVKLVSKYGKKVGDSEDMEVLPENLEKFQEELLSLLEEEIEVDYEPVGLDDLGDIKLTAVEMAALEPFLKE